MPRSRGRGDRGSSPPPLKDHKAIGFLIRTVPNPMKITKLSSQNSMFGHHGPACETPLKWHFTGGRMMARFKWYLDPLSAHQLKHFSQHSGITFWTGACLTFTKYDTVIKRQVPSLVEGGIGSILIG